MVDVVVSVESLALVEVSSSSPPQIVEYAKTPAMITKTAITPRTAVRFVRSRLAACWDSSIFSSRADFCRSRFSVPTGRQASQWRGARCIWGREVANSVTLRNIRCARLHSPRRGMREL